MYFVWACDLFLNDFNNRSRRTTRTIIVTPKKPRTTFFHDTEPLGSILIVTASVDTCVRFEGVEAVSLIPVSTWFCTGVVLPHGSMVVLIFFWKSHLKLVHLHMSLIGSTADAQQNTGCVFLTSIFSTRTFSTPVFFTPIFCDTSKDAGVEKIGANIGVKNINVKK